MLKNIIERLHSNVRKFKYKKYTKFMYVKKRELIDTFFYETSIQGSKTDFSLLNLGFPKK